MDELDGVETRTLEKLRIALYQAVSPELLGAVVESSLHTSWFTNDVVYRVRGYVWAEQVDKITISYPADWWQAVKERFAPERFKRRWPVVYWHYDLDVKVAYPDYKPVVPDHKPVWKVLRNDWKDTKPPE